MVRILFNRLLNYRYEIAPAGSLLHNREKQEMNYTYIIECNDGTYYTGWTNNLDRRLKAHNDGKGAKYTKTRRPVTLIYYEIFETKEQAMRREYEIKQMNRRQKEKLILKN